MTVPHLPDDCIYHILKFLQNDHATLFNCLLVNRFWSIVSVPLLYANPFSFEEESNLNTLIVETFLLCLNKKERMYLIKQNNYSNALNSNSFLNNDLKPFFEYPKYIEQLMAYKFCMVTTAWGYSKQIDKKDDLLNSIVNILYHMFLRQSKCIKILDIGPNLFNPDIFDIQFINTFASQLSKLATLYLDVFDRKYDDKEYEAFSNVLQAIANNCKDLKLLSLFNYYNINNNIGEIVSIINHQRKLKGLILHLQVPNVIFSSLELQKNSLVSLKFSHFIFYNDILQNIIKLHNLKLLEIYECSGLELFKIFEFASFKLKEFGILNNLYDDEGGSDDITSITSQIIKYFGTTLQRLKSNDMNPEIMETITQYNLNLETLDFYYCDKTLSALPYLKILKIKILNIFLYPDDDKVCFIKLAENLPESATKVSIYRYRGINHNSLLNFLNNCHNYIVTLNFNQKFNLKELEIILNYIKKNNNNLKYLGMNLSEVWYVKELDLLNQIREKGVNLVEFSDNLYQESFSFQYY